MINISLVLLCGGSGTRLWPLSRVSLPKQFIDILRNKSLFQLTLSRFLKLNKKNNINIIDIIVVTNEKHRFIVKDQIDDLDLKIPYHIFLEPSSKNTAPALTLASFAIHKKQNDQIMLVSPCDHYIKNEKSFLSTISNTLKFTNPSSILTIGVNPTKPETGFGYIEYAPRKNICEVLSFKEKPNIKLAKKFIKNKNFAWNCGVFILQANTWLEAIKISNSKIYESVKLSWESRTSDYGFIIPDVKSFNLSPSDSIDFSVMEKFKKLGLKVLINLYKSDWNDLGSFESLCKLFPKGKDDNTFRGNVYSVESKNNLVISEKKNICLLGVENLIVIKTSDSTLIASRDKIDSIKNLIDLLKLKNKHILDEAEKVMRPWGYFEVVDEGLNFKVKRIVVKPKSKLSYQSHLFRNEHWVVIKGTAKILCDGKKFTLKTDQSTYIKKKSKHQLINDTNYDLEIIEIQTGSKVIENDIIRYNDIYGR